MSTLKTTNLQESNASGANIVLGTGGGGGATISGVTTSSTLRATTGIVTSLTAVNITSLGDVDIADKIIHTGDTNTAIRFPTNDVVSIDTGGSERLRVHTGGQLLIGKTTSDSVWGYGDTFLQLKGNYSGSSASFINNEDSTNSSAITLAKVRGTSTIVSNNDTLGAIIWQGFDGTDYEPSARITGQVDASPGAGDMPGRLVFETTADGAEALTERMRLDSSGDLGLGTSDPDARLHVQSVAANNSHTSILATGNGNDRWTFGVGTGPDGASSDGNKCVRSGLYFDTGYVAGTTYTRGGSATAGYIAFDTNQTERLRITSAGKVQINTSSSTGSGGEHYQMSIKTTGNDTYHGLDILGMKSGYAAIQCMPGADATYYPMYIRQHDAAYSGKISCYTNNTVSYDNASDYRLKQNDVAITDGIAKVKLLRPIRFEMKCDPGNQLEGFFAHEVQAAVPLACAVNGTKDQVDSDNNPVYQGMDYSKITPILTAALKEAIAEIETLKTKVAALESA